MAHVVPEGDAACRVQYGPGRDPLVHASDGDVHWDGPWERVPLVGYNGATWSSRQAGASATLTFDGTGVRIHGLRQAGAALMRVLVDGAPHAMVDPARGAGPEASVEMLHEVRDLPHGTHRVKVTVADSHGGALGINGFEILRPDPPLPSARLIVDHLWNYPQLDWGNFLRPAVRLTPGLRQAIRLTVGRSLRSG